jgi:hypothetical protein
MMPMKRKMVFLVRRGWHVGPIALGGESVAPGAHSTPDGRVSMTAIVAVGDGERIVGQTTIFCAPAIARRPGGVGST